MQSQCSYLVLERKRSQLHAHKSVTVTAAERPLTLFIYCYDEAIQCKDWRGNCVFQARLLCMDTIDFLLGVSFNYTYERTNPIKTYQEKESICQRSFSVWLPGQSWAWILNSSSIFLFQFPAIYHIMPLSGKLKISTVSVFFICKC